jgi:N-methylhydantoinase B
MPITAIELSIFSNRIAALCEEMGATLGFAALSPNIRDRLDYSCALFDAAGELLGQATHIPVHLGSMAYAMADLVAGRDWQDGDMMIVNDPFLGGTHLPDVSVIAPVFFGGDLFAFVANRAHHADIGADSPGSMPLSTSLDEEGVIIAPSLLCREGDRDEKIWAAVLDRMRNPVAAAADFEAQVAANRIGIRRAIILAEELGLKQFQGLSADLQDYAARLAKLSFAEIPDGTYQFSDVMDSDGQGSLNIGLSVSIGVRGGAIKIDFAGTSEQVKGNINCPMAVTAAAVSYVFRCLLPAQIPACAGALRPVEITAPTACLVNAVRPAAVTAGNVETSMRITDLVLGALAAALPGTIPAAGQGTMNNIAMGSAAADGWDYYETLGGGSGGGAHHPGVSGRQVHMTNTLNTPVEVLERAYPLRVLRYALRRGSGGAGTKPGGDGLVREYQMLSPASVSLLTERRSNAPWGLEGGQAGKLGMNSLDGAELDAKCTFEANTGQRLLIKTPGGGGWGTINGVRLT